MKNYQKNATSAMTRVLPEAVSIAMSELAGDVQEGLLALAVGTGLQVMAAMMNADVEAACGPKGKHDPDRAAVRHGAGDGSVTLGGRRVPVTRPRMRATDGCGELPVASYELFSQTEVLGRMAMQRMLAGLSTRSYPAGLEPVGEKVERTARSTSKSAVSRRFVAATETALAELLAAPLDGLDLVALMIDGVHFGEHLCVVALGIGIDGTKHPLGLAEGSTENTTVVTDLLTGLRERGLDTTRAIFVGIDGGKALRAAVVRVFDHPVIARCQLHRGCKESTWLCRGVVVRCGGVEEGASGGQPVGSRGGVVSDLGQDRADLAHDVADGASADLEQFGEGVLAA